MRGVDCELQNVREPEDPMRGDIHMSETIEDPVVVQVMRGQSGRGNHARSASLRG